MKCLPSLSKRLLATTVAGLMALTPVAHACKGLALKTQDGGYVSGRTAEFGLELNRNALFVPRSISFEGTRLDGSSGMRCKS